MLARFYHPLNSERNKMSGITATTPPHMANLKCHFTNLYYLELWDFNQPEAIGSPDSDKLWF
jgi:hypothetical protein